MLKKILLSILFLPIIGNAENINTNIIQILSHSNNPIDNHLMENIQKIDVDKNDYDSFILAVEKLIDHYEFLTHYKFSNKEKQLILLNIFSQKDSQHHCLLYKDNLLKISNTLNTKWPENSECIKNYNQNNFIDINSASYIININYIIKPLQDKVNDNLVDNFVEKVVSDKGLIK